MGATRITKGRVLVGGVDQDGLAVRTLRVPLRPTAGIGQVLSGKRIPAGSVLLNAYVKSTGASAATVGASRLNVGTTTATIAYLTSLDIAAAGIKVGSLASGFATLGAALQETTTAGPVAKAAVIDADVEVTYATLAPSPNLNGDLIIEYRKLG